jgi:hypothetical protein
MKLFISDFILNNSVLSEQNQWQFCYIQQCHIMETYLAAWRFTSTTEVSNGNYELWWKHKNPIQENIRHKDSKPANVSTIGMSWNYHIFYHQNKLLNCTLPPPNTFMSYTIFTFLCQKCHYSATQISYRQNLHIWMNCFNNFIKIQSSHFIFKLKHQFYLQWNYLRDSGQTNFLCELE